MRIQPAALRWAILCAGIAAGAAAQTQPPSNADLIVLINGDRITGEIKSYNAGRVKVVTDHEGDVSIKWNKIASITSTTVFDVEMTSGIHYIGVLEPSVPPGKLSILAAGGTLTVGFLDVARISPLHKRFWRRIDGSLDLGFTYTHASDITQFNLNTNAIYRVNTWTVQATLSSFYSKQKDVTSSQRDNFSLFYTKYFKSPWIVGGGLGLDRNKDLGLDLRVLGEVGVGRKLIQTNQTVLLAIVGLSGSHETPVEGEDKYTAEALVAAKYSTFTYDYPKFNLDATISVYPSLTEGGRVRLEANAKARQELARDFYLSLSAYYSLDTRDPTTGQSRSDWGPILSIGFTF